MFHFRGVFENAAFQMSIICTYRYRYDDTPFTPINILVKTYNFHKYHSDGLRDTLGVKGGRRELAE